MKKFFRINRPSWISQKTRELNKLWLDKNENTHPKLINLYHKILKRLIQYTFQPIQNLVAYTKNIFI